MKITVLGNGGFGTAMAVAAQRLGHTVSVWGHDAAYTAEIEASRTNPRYLPGDIAIAEGITFGADPTVALDRADIVLVAIPTQHVRGAMAGPLVGALGAGVPLVSLAKGLEQSTGLRPSEVLAELAPDRPVLVLSGPSHAEEVARGLPALLVVAGADGDARRLVQDALSDHGLRVYRNEDPLGVELCGALKNVMAVAAGIAEGLGLGDNTKAAIVSRGLVEMVRFVEAEGGRADTVFGLAGVGDLAVTAFSPHGRNRAFGVRIGQGETLDQILESTRKVAEGVWTSRVVRGRAEKLGIEMPLCEAVCRVLFEGLRPDLAVRELMERDAKREMG
jgi:glycerol-3-phosphate dehydrogenase (NAD(P)+)